MSTWDDYAEAELWRVMDGEAIRHPVHDKWQGGEYDALRALPKQVKRTLTGARMLVPGGLEPDVAADLIRERCRGDMDVDDAVEWYVQTCLATIRSRRRNAHWRRHHRLAARNGFETYWYYRKAYLQEGEEAA